MSVEPLPPTAGSPAVHTALSGLGEVVAQLRQVLREAEASYPAIGTPVAPAR